MRQGSRASELALLFPFKRAKLIIFPYMGMPRGILLSGPGISPLQHSANLEAGLDMRQCNQLYSRGCCMACGVVHRQRLAAETGTLSRVCDHSYASLRGFRGCCWHHVALSVLLPMLTVTGTSRPASWQRCNGCRHVRGSLQTACRRTTRTTYCSK